MLSVYFYFALLVAQMVCQTCYPAYTRDTPEPQTECDTMDYGLCKQVTAAPEPIAAEA